MGSLFVLTLLLFGPPPAAATPPKVVSRTDALYPEAALKERREGTVLLAVTVGIDGRVDEVEVIESAGADMDAAASAAMREWHFEPARSGEALVPSRVRIPITFKLPAAPESAAPDASTAATPGETPDAGAQSNDAGVQPSDAGTPSSDAGIQPSDAGTPPPTAEGATDSGEPLEVTVTGRARPPSRGASDYQLEVGALARVPKRSASELLTLAPGIFLSNEGGEAHAHQIFMRGFDAREGQDVEMTVDGVPINESGNLHGNGYADTNFIIPELVERLRVIEGPFDPRQGNYAVAGSVDYQLGLSERGAAAKLSVGSFGTYRALLTYGPKERSRGTFLAAELYQTDGFGPNRDGRRGSFLGQFEGKVGEHTALRVTANAYLASFHSAGVLREDDLKAGRVRFFDTYDTLQGIDSSRYSVAASVHHHAGNLIADVLVYFIYRPLRTRENFTGFLLDPQEPVQTPHIQRGDLLDMRHQAFTFGSKGSVRWETSLFGWRQAVEAGYVARGDIGSATRQRVEKATSTPYRTDNSLDFRLGDFGLYIDLDLSITRWVKLRGGVRADLFTYDVDNLCAVQSVQNPSRTNPPGDASCLTQRGFGAYREANQRASTSSFAVMPRGSLILGPWKGISLSGSVGRGVRSIDPGYIIQDSATPFAAALGAEGGIAYTGTIADLIDITARTVVFNTFVDKDLIFSQTEGRNTLAGATNRLGSATTARVRGPHFDVTANFTYVRAVFEDTKLLIPYIPNFVLRLDGATFWNLPWRPRGHAIELSAGLGLSYVAPRPLPYGDRSDAVLTVDGLIGARYWFAEISFSMQNIADARYRLGEYNYTSDFRSASYPTLVPVRHFSAGPPRTFLFSLTLRYGGAR